MSVANDDERAAMAVCLLRELIVSFERSDSQVMPWAEEVVPTLTWLREYLIGRFGPEEIDGNSYEYYMVKRRRARLAGRDHNPLR